MGARGPARRTRKKPTLRPGVPPPPSWLSDGAKKEYRRSAKELLNGNVDVHRVDMAILAAYAQSYDDVSRLSIELREEGETLLTERGTPVANPKVTALSGAYNRLRQNAMRLGFSPLDRQRVPVSENTESEPDELDDLLGLGIGQ